MRAIGKHSPDLALTVAGGLEDDVAAIRSPTGALVLAAVAGDLTDLAGGGFHDVDVEVAVGTSPTEGDHLAVGRPRRVDQIAFVWKTEFASVGAVGVHEVELGYASAIADEYDALAGLGVPCWRGACGVGKGDTLGAAAVGVDDEEFGVAEHGGGKHDLRAVGRPGRGAGALLEPRKRGKETTLLASMEYMQICGLTTLVGPASKQVKAMREASGDQRGVREIVCSDVSGCWLAPS